jgi:hypothetical protein
VDSDEYQNILLRPEIVKNLNDHYGAFGWYFMQDRVSAHTSRATADFFKARCLVLPGWPPNSPKLNSIEMVWAIMKTRVKKLALQTKAELEEIIAKVWEELDQNLLNRLLIGFILRFEMLIKARGRSISPYLSSHRSEPTAEDAAANPDFRPFTPKEDESILALVNPIENRWKRIYEILEPDFGPRQRTEVRH